MRWALLLLLLLLPALLLATSIPSSLSSLVARLKVAILSRDVGSVKLYLDQIENLGHQPPARCATSSPTLETGKSKKSRTSLRKHDEPSTALATLTSSYQTCKHDLSRLNQYVDASRRHQQQEVEKLKVVRKGVETLLHSLKGVQTNLDLVRRESSERQVELGLLQKQAAAAAQLEQEISEIQEHARINYETGELEMEGKTLVSHAKNQDTVHKIIRPVDPAIMHADPRLLFDLVVLLGASVVGGLLAAGLGLPHIVGYLAGGVVVGPSGLELVRAVVQVETMAQFGSVFFLFGHGLEYSLKEQKRFQSVSLGGSLLSTALIAVIIQLLCLFSGVVSGPMEGLLVGMSISLSSLSVVLDYVHAQGLEQSTQAKVMVGVLGFQGLLMGLFVSLPPALSGGRASFAWTVSEAVFGVAIISFVAFVFSRNVLPRLLQGLLHSANAKSNHGELYLLAVVAIAMGMAILTESLGLSLDLGAFVAGLMLSGSKDTTATAHVIQPLASVFGSMLFGSLGMIINLEFFYKNLDEILALAIELVVVKAVVIALVVRLFDYHPRICILVGLGLSHVGEFSLIFSSKLHAHNLITRRAYLLFLAASVSTLAVAPLVLRGVSATRFLAIDKEGDVGAPPSLPRPQPPPSTTEWRRWRA